MKNMTCWGLVGLLLLAVLGTPALALDMGTNLVPVTEQEAAAFGATDVLIIRAVDLAAYTSTNTAVSVTNTLPAKSLVECKGLRLVTPFSVGTTNYTDSFLLTVGKGGSASFYIASTELAEDGTEVYWVAPPGIQTITLGINTNGIGTNAGAVQSVQIVTNTNFGPIYMAAASTIIFGMTPDGNQALADFVKGEVRVYFRIHTY